MTEIEKYEDLKSIAEETGINLEVNIKKDSNTDTEIFIRKPNLKIYSFRHAISGGYYDRWNNYGDKKFTRKELITLLQQL